MYIKCHCHTLLPTIMDRKLWVASNKKFLVLTLLPTIMDKKLWVASNIKILALPLFNPKIASYV